MLKHLTDLITKISVLPFTEEYFFRTTVIQDLIEVCNQEDTLREYSVYEDLIKDIYRMSFDNHIIENTDMVGLLIEQYYPLQSFYKKTNINEYFLQYLSDLSNSFISQRNGKVALKYWSNETYEKLFGAFDGYNKIELWNSFNRQFCVDLLVINYLLDNGMDGLEYLSGYYWSVNVGDLQLDQIINKGLSETHIHINAGIDFPIMWEELMDLERLDLDTHELLVSLKDDKYKSMLLQAGIIQRYIVSVIRGRTLVPSEDKSKRSDSTEIALQQLKEIIDSVLRGKKINHREYDYKSIYRCLADPYLDQRAESVRTTRENVFLFEAMNYLRTNMDDINFGKMFWSYITIKNIFYSKSIQNNYREGLEFFTNYYNRATSSMISRQKYLYKAIDNQIRNNNFKKMEVRLNPGITKRRVQTKQNMIDKLKEFLQVYLDLIETYQGVLEVPKLGIVFHMIKSEDKRKFNKCWYEEDMKGRLAHAYGSQQEQYMDFIDILNELREEIPHLSKYLVGIDAASKENDAEPWVFASIYKQARDSKYKQIKWENQRAHQINNLGFTFHVGEEFRHIYSGLRHIDEVIEHFGYHAGDRIGHGIVLGINVEEWIANHPIVILPRQEYLENLLWIWGMGYQQVIEPNVFNFASIEREIMDQARAIYEHIEGITVYNLWMAYQMKFGSFKSDPDFRQEYNEETCESERSDGNPITIFCCKAKDMHNYSWNAVKLNHAYHCKCYIERAKQVIQVKVNKEHQGIMESLQRCVRKKISNKGIVVETNPSSNLAISGIERLFKHYITSLNTNGLDPYCSSDRGLVITINSDDPAVFNTTISNEFAYIFYLLQEKGYSRDSILEWIDKVRTWGLETSFVENSAISEERRVDEIKGILEALK